jgi:hypothetical protein
MSAIGLDLGQWVDDVQETVCLCDIGSAGRDGPWRDGDGAAVA